MKIKLFIIILSLLFSSILFSFNQHKLFIIASYNKDDLCGAPQMKGALDSIYLENKDKLEIKKFYLNSKTLPKEDILKRIEIIKKAIKSENPEIILTFDDLAFSTFAPVIIKDPTKKLVFSGVNNRLSYYNKKFHFYNEKTMYPIKNITGIHEYLFIKRQFQFFKIVFNKIPNVAVIYSTDIMGTILHNQVIDELKGTKYINYLHFYKISTLKELYNVINIIKNDKSIDAYFPFVMSIKDSNGKIYNINKIIPILIKNINKPDIAINEAFTKIGLFGGVSVDFYKMGYRAGQMVNMILNGTDIKTIKIEDASDYKILINLKRLKQLNFKLNNEAFSIVDGFIK
jgi:ABC-type uncharacterized transport system substrate-binding protein